MSVERSANLERVRCRGARGWARALTRSLRLLAASDGTGALVVWEDYRGSAAPAIVGSRLSALGEVLDPAGIVIAGDAAARRSPAVVFDGANDLVVWAKQRGVGLRDVCAARVVALASRRRRPSRRSF